MVTAPIKEKPKDKMISLIFTLKNGSKVNDGSSEDADVQSISMYFCPD